MTGGTEAPNFSHNLQTQKALTMNATTKPRKNEIARFARLAVQFDRDEITPPPSLGTAAGSEAVTAIARLENDLARQRDEIGQLRQQLADAQDDRQASADSELRTEAERDLLKQQLADAEQELADTKATMKEETEQAESELAESREYTAELEARVEELERAAEIEGHKLTQAWQTISAERGKRPHALNRHEPTDAELDADNAPEATAPRPIESPAAVKAAAELKAALDARELKADVQRVANRLNPKRRKPAQTTPIPSYAFHV